MTTDHPFKTSDTALATFLIVSGFALESIDYSKPRYEYLFFDSQDIKERAYQYVTGQALTEPIAFDRINKKLLRIIRHQKQWEED